MIKVQRNGCARALNNSGPPKTGVWILNVKLKFSTWKVCEKKLNSVHVRFAMFLTSATQEPSFTLEMLTFFNENSPAPFSGRYELSSHFFFAALRSAKRVFADLKILPGEHGDRPDSLALFLMQEHDDRPILEQGWFGKRVTLSAFVWGGYMEAVLICIDKACIGHMEWGGGVKINSFCRKTMR
jgi:hypothetical protein